MSNAQNIAFDRFYPIIKSYRCCCFSSSRVLDGGFEEWSGNNLLYWDFTPNGATLERTAGRTGSCAKITIEDGENPALKTYLGSVTPGGSIDFAMYINGNDTTAHIVMYQRIGYDDGSDMLSVLGDYQVTPYSWTQLDPALKFLPSNAINVSFRLTFYYDFSFLPLRSSTMSSIDIWSNH
jgi:hypothetical protein